MKNIFKIVFALILFISGLTAGILFSSVCNTGQNKKAYSNEGYGKTDIVDEGDQYECIINYTFQKDNFDPWLIDFGKWYIKNGNLICDDNGSIILLNFNEAKYILEVDLKFAASNRGGGAGVHTQDISHNWMHDPNFNVFLQLFPDTDIIQLYPRNLKSYTIEPNQWYKVKFKVNGNNITVYLDGQMIYKDVFNFKSGSINLGADDKTYFDNFKIYK